MTRIVAAIHFDKSPPGLHTVRDLPVIPRGTHDVRLFDKIARAGIHFVRLKTQGSKGYTLLDLAVQIPVILCGVTERKLPVRQGAVKE